MSETIIELNIKGVFPEKEVLQKLYKETYSGKKSKELKKMLKYIIEERKLRIVQINESKMDRTSFDKQLIIKAQG